MSLGLNGSSAGSGVGSVTFESGSISVNSTARQTITFQSTPKVVFLTGNGTANMSIKFSIMTPNGDLTQNYGGSSTYGTGSVFDGHSVTFDPNYVYGQTLTLKIEILCDLYGIGGSIMSLTINGSGGGTPVGTPTIETGSYIGTGTYGSSKPNSITFNGAPVFVYVQRKNTDIMSMGEPVAGFFVTGATYDGALQMGSYMYPVQMSVTGNTLSWWYSTTTNNGPIRQLNENGVTYVWVAFTL